MTTQTIESPPEIAAPAETRTPLKLSEALRLGAMSTEQTFGSLGDSEHTCALGAIMLGFGLPWNSDQSVPNGEFGELLDSHMVPCQTHWNRPESLTTAIFHLNDESQWPREKIADWLESLGL